MNEFNTILKLLESFLGQSYKGLTDDLQCQFDCPVCSMNKGLYEGDGKHNLEVNLQKLKFNCWVCGQTDETYGSISKLIKMFGSYDVLIEYKEIIQSIKQTKLYELKFNTNDFIDTDEEFLQDSGILLPYGFKPLNENDYFSKNAINYLKNRNINQEIIDKYNIGYIGNSKDKKLSNRIIVPSYDKFNILNYWVGRDYINDKTNKWRTKYENPESVKSEIVFNEGKINWYGDITLVEGVFDHIIIPNSIPLLGKVLKPTYAIYNALLQNAKSNINIFLDDDAFDNAMKIYKILNQGNLYNKIYIIPCPENLDAALLYQIYGKKGIIDTIKNKIKIPEYNLT